MAHWHRLGVAIGITALVGCGSPSPEGPVSSPSIGSAAAVVSPPVADARAQTAASPADTPPPDEQTTAEYAQREARYSWGTEVREHPDATVRLQALEVWAQQPGTGIDPLTYPLEDQDEQVRAQELLAEQPGTGIDPLTYPLEDQDEQVRAQELLAEQLTQEVEADVP